MDTEQAEDSERSAGTVAPVVYVALGDSTGVGLGASKGGYVARLFHRILRIRPGARLHNLCESGAASSDVLRSQLRRAVAARPTLITLCIGINDATQGVGVEQFGRNLTEVLARLQAGCDAPLVLSNVPDLSLAPIVPPALRAEAHHRVSAYNQRITEVARARDLTLVDMYHHSREVIPAHPEFFSPDQFHPSDAGYEYWAFLMWPAIKTALGGR